MDFRFSLTGVALALSLLLSGCSDKSDEDQQAAFKAKADEFAKKLDTVQDPKLKEAISNLGGSLLMLDRIQLEMVHKPVETEYTADSLALLKDYPDTKTVTDTYINGLFVQRKASDSDYLTTLEPVFPFTPHSPAEFPFPQNLRWQSVTLDNKKTVPFVLERAEDSGAIQLAPSQDTTDNVNGLDLIYPYHEDAPPLSDKTKPKPVTLNGDIQVVTPRKVSTFEFSKKDVGQKRTDDNITLTLLALDKNYAEVEVSNRADLAEELIDDDFNPLIIQAQDKTGQFLSRAGGITQNATQIAFYEKQLAALMNQKTWDETLQHQQEAELHAFNRQQKTHYAKMYFNGVIDKVQVSVLDYSQSKISETALSVPVRQFDEHTFGQSAQPLLLPVVVYDAEAANYLKSYEMDEEQLKKSIVIHQDVTNPQDARIEFTHPPTFNDDMLGTSISPAQAPITFYAPGDGGKAGKEIQPPLDSYEINFDESYVSYDLSQFPLLPAYVSGAMPLYLAHIEKSFMDVGKLPKGLTLKSNALVVDQTLFPSEQWRFYAKDSKGKYLKEALSVSHSAIQYSTATVDVHYFYGEPTTLEAYQRTGVNPVSYAFKVKLDKPDAATLQQLQQAGSEDE
ncbi:MAG: hypothetical protein JWP80_5231 [Pseudomonas sp.]|nr:hypothetical protein [Pseudomonas sp.]